MQAASSSSSSSSSSASLNKAPRRPAMPLCGTAAIIQYAKDRGFLPQQQMTSRLSGLAPVLLKEAAESSSWSSRAPVTWFGNSHALGTNVPEELGFLLVDRFLLVDQRHKECPRGMSRAMQNSRLIELLNLFPKADPEKLASARDREARIKLHSEATEALLVRYLKGNSERVSRLIDSTGRGLPPLCVRAIQKVAQTLFKLNIHDIHGSDVTRELFTQAPFTNVEQFRLYGDITGFNFTGLPKLHRLSVSYYRGFDREEIENIPASVTSLHLPVSSKVSLSVFSRFRALQELSLTTNGSFADKDPFEALQPLQGSLTSLKLQVEGFEGPRDLPQSYTKLASFTRLTRLAIKSVYRAFGYQDPVRDFSFMRSLPLLETIELPGESLHDRDIAMLAHHPRLSQVAIEGNVSPDIYSILATLPELETFSHPCSWSEANGDKIKLLAANRKLRHVTLLKRHLGQDSMEALQHLTQVTDLGLFQPKVALPSMASLRALKIKGRISDRVLHSVKEQLRELRLPDGFFDENRTAGEKLLLEMKQLKVLEYRFKETDSQVVQRELPNTEVIKPGSTVRARF